MCPIVCRPQPIVASTRKGKTDMETLCQIHPHEDAGKQNKVVFNIKIKVAVEKKPNYTFFSEECHVYDI